MKQQFLLAGCLVFLLGLAGCQNANTADKGVEVIIEGDDQFPEFLVGTWKSRGKSHWELVFEPDGTISSAVINLGNVRLKPGQKTREKTRSGGTAEFESGKWMVIYSHVNRELMVNIVLNYFYMEMGSNVLEGSRTDVLIGKINTTGDVWQVEWTSFPYYTAHTTKHPDFEISAPDHGLSQGLTFEKAAL